MTPTNQGADRDRPTARPHDVADLFLSPVVLDLDQQLAAYGSLSDREVALRVVLATNREPDSPEERAALALQAVTHLVDTHGWEVSWAPRGLRVSHDNHELVLGVPESLDRYMSGH